MGRETGISWTDATHNIAWGCIEASPGCDFCYARVLANRYGYGWGKGAARRIMSDKYWQQPRNWNAKALKDGNRVKVFCSSMTDVFLNDPVIDSERENRLWPLIRETPMLDWQLLTKHPERFIRLPEDLPSNVWLGVSVENADYTYRIDALRKTHARVKFISFEPLIGDVGVVDLHGIDWVIIGGESGAGARPCEEHWMHKIAVQASLAGAKVFVKQLGSVLAKQLGVSGKGDDPNDLPRDLRIQEFPV